MPTECTYVGYVIVFVEKAYKILSGHTKDPLILVVFNASYLIHPVNLDRMEQVWFLILNNLWWANIGVVMTGIGLYKQTNIYKETRNELVF